MLVIFASYEYPKLVSRICTILETASNESLVLIDEICSGTDPSYGAALSTCILQLIMLIQVTWKDKDSPFENAAMEFSLQTLRSKNIIERAQKHWVEKLVPEKQQERSDMLYQSLLEERERVEAQARKAASLHREIMELYHEVKKSFSELNKDEDVCYGPRVHCSSMSASEPHSVIFVVHGTGTGAVKECALEVQGELTLPHAEETSLVPVSPLAEYPLAGE
ncbi:hypothetical protein Peur_061513 [Populus x canadensis]